MLEISCLSHESPAPKLIFARLCVSQLLSYLFVSFKLFVPCFSSGYHPFSCAQFENPHKISMLFLMTCIRRQGLYVSEIHKSICSF